MPEKGPRFLGAGVRSPISHQVETVRTYPAWIARQCRERFLDSSERPAKRSAMSTHLIRRCCLVQRKLGLTGGDIREHVEDVCEFENREEGSCASFASEQTTRVQECLVKLDSHAPR